MGFPQKRVTRISPDDYLRMEEAAATKHEYLDGLVYDWQGGRPAALARGSVAHNQVSGNVAVSLRAQLRGGPCRVLIADVRLNLADRSAYFYPDVMVSCSEADRARSDGISEPQLVVEVLSGSTEDFDRGDKFASYRRIESLQAYVLVSPDLRTVEVFTRAGGWQPPEPQRQGTVALGHRELRLELADVFEGL